MRAVKIPAGEKMEVYIYLGPDFLENEAICIQWSVACMAYDVGVAVAFTELYVTHSLNFGLGSIADADSLFWYGSTRCGTL